MSLKSYVLFLIPLLMGCVIGGCRPADSEGDRFRSADSLPDKGQLPSSVSVFGGENVQSDSKGRPTDLMAVKAVVLPTGEKVEAVAVCVLKYDTVQAMNIDGTPNPSFADKVAAKLNTLTETSNIYIPYRFGYWTVYVAVKHTYAAGGWQNALWFLQTGESGLTGIEYTPGKDRDLPVLYSLRLSEDFSTRNDLVLYPGFVKPNKHEVAIYVRQYEPQKQTRLDFMVGAAGKSGKVGLELVSIDDLKRREDQTWCQVQIKSSEPKKNVELSVVPELIKLAKNGSGNGSPMGSSTGMAVMGAAPSKISRQNEASRQPVFVEGNVRVMYAGSTGNLHRFNMNVPSSQIKAINVQANLKKTIKIGGIPVPKG